MDYVHRVPPWRHQQLAFELSRDREEFALLMEQRTGKSKVLIDTCAWSYARGRIAGTLIFAPNGVHEDWVNEYFPTHWPEWAGEPITAIWNGRLRKRDEAALYDVNSSMRFRVLAMNTEGLSSSPRARDAAMRFVRTFDALMALDESSDIQHAKSSRTKWVTKIGRVAKMRRIMDGTPIDGNPLGLYTQFRFLSPDLLGFSSFFAYKAHFAELLPEGHALLRAIQEKSSRARRVVPQVVARDAEGRPQYKNLEELQALIAPHSFRVTRAECEDLPDKVYSQRSVPLSSRQHDLYEQARKSMLLEFEHGAQLTIPNQLTRLGRLQQITGGFFPRDDGTTSEIDVVCPRIEALMQEVEKSRGKIVVWARYRPELARIARALREAYGAPAVGEYHGGVARDERQRVRTNFQNANWPRFFVGQQAAGGRGLLLNVADDTLYYSNTFSLRHRLQSEDRVIALDKKRASAYTDLVAPGTVDVKIRAALTGKKDVADILLDTRGMREWLRAGE